MAEIDYRLLAGIPQSYMQGYLGAEKLQQGEVQNELLRRKMALEQRKLEQENAKRQLLASYLAPPSEAGAGQPPAAGAGDLYGIGAVAAPAGGAQVPQATPGQPGRAPVPGMVSGNTPVNPEMANLDRVQRALLAIGDIQGANAIKGRMEMLEKPRKEQEERWRQEAKTEIDIVQRNIQILATQGDQEGLNRYANATRERLLNSGNPLLEKAANSIVDVRLKGDALEVVSVFSGEQLANAGVRGIDPSGRFKVTTKNGKMIKIEPGKGDPTDFKSIMALRKEAYDSNQIKQFDQLDTQKTRMDSVWREAQARESRGEKVSYNAVDQVLITMLNKILDPTSVVRESEYARTNEGMALLSRIEGYLPRLAKGGAGLTPQERQELVNVVDQMYRGTEPAVVAEAQQYMDIASSYDMDPGQVLPASVVRAVKRSKSAPVAAPMTQPAPAPSGGKFTIIGVQ